jgi:transcriptional regulator with XRE-family HTH domain
MKNMRTVLNELLSEDLTPAQYLRGLRLDAKISQDDLQEITGVARTNISAMENGRMEVSAHYAILFGVALNVHPAEILFPNGHFEKTKEIQQIEKKGEVIRKKRSAT